MIARAADYRTFNLRLAFPACLLVFLGLMAGCSQFDLEKRIPWKLDDDEYVAPPDRLVAMWADTVLHQSGGPAIRGFGGRLMFHGKDEGRPVKANGKLIVYAFDEDRENQENFKPDRKFVFTAEQFANHYSKSDLGHSYSVWIPWDKVGGPQKQVSLIARFISEDGSVVVSEQARHILPGLTTLAKTGPAKKDLAAQADKPPETSTGRATNPQEGQVVHASYEAGQSHQPSMMPETDQSTEQLSGTGRLNTTTIDIPARFGRRMPVAAGRAPVSGSRAAAEGSSGTGGRAAGRSAGDWPARQSSTRFSRPRSRVLGEPLVRPVRDHARWQQPRVESPSAGESALPTESSPGCAMNWSADRPALY